MVLLPLTLAVLLSFGQCQGSPSHCCRRGKNSPTPQCVSCDNAPNCKNVIPLSTSLTPLSRLSPTFPASVLKASQYVNENAACVTSLDAGQGVFLQFRTVILLDGSVLILKFLSTGVPGSPGKYILVGVTSDNGGVLVRYEYTINEVSCKNCQILGYYSCTLYTNAEHCSDTGVYFYGTDNLFTRSSCQKTPSSCLNQTEAQLVASNNFNVPGFFNLPYTLPLKCVCSFNGIDVTNRNLIADDSCVSLP